jgi:hypothetical protein
MAAKISRKQIAEALDQIPVEHLLLGSAGRELTAKQKRFARHIAEGNTGADAYRKAYNAKGTPKSVGSNASRLKADERMQLELTRLKALQEIREQQSPAQIRATVIERLQLEATDAENPPAARIRALELLGKVTEVAAFTERREQTVIHSSEAIKQQIMDRLRNLTAIDITPLDALNADADALSLEAELSAAESATDSEEGIVDAADYQEGLSADPTEGVCPDIESESRGAYVHNVPHKHTP